LSQWKGYTERQLEARTHQQARRDRCTMQSVMAELVLYMAHCQEQMATGCQFKETRLAKTAFEQLRANIEIRREEKAEIELIEAQQVEARMEPAIQMAKGRQDSKI